MATVLAVPIALASSGQLQRADPADAIASLIGVMAATSERFWPHAPWFGLQEQFERARSDVQDHPRLADAINTALRELGTTDVRVVTVSNAPSAYGDRRFDITLVGADDAPLFRQIGV